MLVKVITKPLLNKEIDSMQTAKYRLYAIFAFKQETRRLRQPTSPVSKKSENFAYLDYYKLAVKEQLEEWFN
jgi:hypothetical protein